MTEGKQRLPLPQAPLRRGFVLSKHPTRPIQLSKQILTSTPQPQTQAQAQAQQTLSIPDKQCQPQIAFKRSQASSCIHHNSYTLRKVLLLQAKKKMHFV